MTALAQEAVKELEYAVHVGGSQKVAAQWDWILREDPDLSGLRAEPDFLRFESERFPSSQPAPLRPIEIVKLVAARHSGQLCEAVAGVCEKQWHSRAEAAAATNPHDALGWWDEEREAWRLVDELSRDHRSWQTRLEVIKRMQKRCASHDLEPFVVPQPVYSDQPIVALPREIDNVARQELQHLDKRINALHKELEDHEHLRQLDAWEAFLESLDVAGRKLDADATARLATNRASAWGDLRIAMRRRLDVAGDLHDATHELTAAASALAELPMPLLSNAQVVAGRRRLLVVANRTLDGEQLRAELLRRSRKGLDFHVVAPTLALRDHYDTSDIATEINDARQRVRDVLLWASKNRLRATGKVGDPYIGVGLIPDELGSSGAEEILVGTLPEGRSNWITNGLVQDIATSTGIEIEHLLVDLRVFAMVDSRVAKNGWNLSEVASDLHAFLKGTPPFHAFEWRENYFAVVVNASPRELAEKLRDKLRKHKKFKDLEPPLLVTTHEPSKEPKPAVLARVLPGPTAQAIGAAPNGAGQV